MLSFPTFLSSILRTPSTSFPHYDYFWDDPFDRSRRNEVISCILSEAREEEERRGGEKRRKEERRKAEYTWVLWREMDDNQF